jgi:hypothetical protein
VTGRDFWCISDFHNDEKEIAVTPILSTEVRLSLICLNHNPVSQLPNPLGFTSFTRNSGGKEILRSSSI